MNTHPNDKAYTMGYQDGVKAEKERVLKMIEDVRKDIPKITREPFELAENVGKNIALDTLLDNLK